MIESHYIVYKMLYQNAVFSVIVEAKFVFFFYKNKNEQRQIHRSESINYDVVDACIWSEWI